MSLPWAKGFRPPTDVEKIRAISLGSGDNHFKEKDKLLEPDTAYFHPVPRPTCIDDWLHQYPEKPQTAKEFVESNPWISSRSRKGTRQKFVATGRFILDKYPDGKIYIVTLGKSPPNAPSADALAKYTSTYFQIPCVLLPDIELQERDDKVFWTDGRDALREVTSRRYSKGSIKHRQLQIDSVLNLLKAHCRPNDAFCLVAVTMEDLYDADSDLFVAGTPSLKTCVRDRNPLQTQSDAPEIRS